jgi:cell wall-associated NlpC family hydrolase
MSVFLYAPGIKVYISTQDNGILDISEDLTQGNLSRRSDGISTFSFSLQNARRKYDGVFTPNDRIIVMMKRLTWLRVFTGYLNAVPLVTAWPQVVQLTASCSLKRLQYWFWDPGTEAATSLVNTALTAVKNPDDGGVSNAVLSIMNNVVGWPPTKVHIAGIPQSWFKWAYKIAKDVNTDLEEADALAQQFYAVLSGNGTVGGKLGGGTVASNALKAGTYGGQALSTDETGNAVLIYNTAMSMGLTAQDAVIGIECAMGESHLTNIQTPNSAQAYGLFQQRPSQGWGTVAQVTNAQYATRKFFSVEQTVPNRLTQDPGQVVVTVQRPGVGPDYYDQFKEMATQIVNILVKGQGGTSLGNSPAFGQLSSNWKSGKASGTAILQTAENLVSSDPSIPYQLGSDSPPNDPNPSVLDCSSFVQWVIFHTFGNLNGCPRTASAQAGWCKARGKMITAKQGMNTPGALMYHSGNGSINGVGHTEISVGDGQNTIGAHQQGTFAGEGTSAGYWTFAGLAPNTDYSGTAGGTPSGGVGTLDAGGLQLTTSNSQPWFNPSDPFEKLFGASPWVPQVDTVDMATSAALTGVRALLNDQPLLPYLKNLLNSTMRSFSSAPNGDFIAWFPDYYGVWGTAAIMRIEPIELQDFTVYWDDTNFVTHQYTVAPYSNQALNLQTATIDNVGPLNAVTTSGVATIDIPAIMYSLFGLEPTKQQAQKFISYVYNRFGARPDFQQLPGVVGPQGEFFSALFLFQRQWAYQYNADVPMTFMPELWPGMLIQVPAFGFQAYCTTVTHSFQMGQGGFFNTTVNIAAPARLPGSDGDSNGRLIGLPLAGGLGSAPNIGPTPGG